jgi:alginate O-acetyltransferase complex protein AlgI
VLFNSLAFALFLPAVFLLYWRINSNKIEWRNGLILLSSLFFYGWWDWRFLGLILSSALLDYFIGGAIHASTNSKRRSLLFALSLGFNLGALAFFKYYNFFIESFVSVLSSAGLQPNIHTLEILLPVGISFYTFQTLSYTIDIYRNRLKPESNLLAFASYVTFFPQLVAGPIERASHLLPQFSIEKRFDSQVASEGLRFMLWGFFMKLVIADNAAIIVNQIFDAYDVVSGATLYLGALLFAFQIYGDFAGYSYIAIGVAKLFGFDLMTNFRYPYLATNISEFWRRWHISLSTWFRDYVYIPLGGNRGGLWKHFRNLFLTFFISGFWHGANWTFLVWGSIHWSLYVIEFGIERLGMNMPPAYGNAYHIAGKRFIGWGITFLLVTVAWIFFRAESIDSALEYTQGLILRPLFAYGEDAGLMRLLESKWIILLILTLLGVEFLQRNRLFVLDIKSYPTWIRYSIYSVVTMAIVFFGKFNSMEFIYFQF